MRIVLFSKAIVAPLVLCRFVGSEVARGLGFCAVLMSVAPDVVLLCCACVCVKSDGFGMAPS